MPTAIVDTQTNEFVPTGHAPDARYVVKTVPRTPDPATEKYSGSDADPITAKTSAEIAATLATQKLDAALLTSRQLDVLTTVAFIIRRANPTAWTNATLASKKSQVLAEADTWRDMRIWAEDNL